MQLLPASEPASVDQSLPEPASVGQSLPEPASVGQSLPEPASLRLFMQCPNLYMQQFPASARSVILLTGLFKWSMVLFRYEAMPSALACMQAWVL
jgi:hypothetical protein